MKKRPLQIQSDFFENVWCKSDIDAVFKYFDGEAGGLGAGEPLDPVGYIDFYHALSSVVKDVQFEFLSWIEQDNKLFFDFVMKGRARRKDKAIFWAGSAFGTYRDGKISGGENFLDFLDLFRQLELMPEETVELGLAGSEILDIGRDNESLGTEFRRLFWPNYQGLGTQQKLPSTAQLEVLFQSALFGMVITDTGDEILNTNQHLDRLLGSGSDELVGTRFGDLIAGKGQEAERRARESLLQRKIPNYRILLHLNGPLGMVRVWVSAVVFQRESGAAWILRSIERDELLDDLVSMQEAERRLLSEELNRDVLRPVLELWSHIAADEIVDLGVRDKCRKIASEMAEKLRHKIKSLRNPILEGSQLSEAWAEKEFDRAVDIVGETTALLAYRVVTECLVHFGGSIYETELKVSNGWLKGRVPVRPEKDQERVSLLRNLCHLLNGRLYEDNDGSILVFELPGRPN